MHINTLQLAKISSAAYSSKAVLRNFGFDNIVKFECARTNTVGYLCLHYNSKQCVVVFRGTDHLEDWATNLNLIKVATPLNREIHRGFQEAYNSVKDALREMLEPLVGWDLYCTAHSLGGALACLLALQSGFKFKQVVTFGQPRFMGVHGYTNMSKYNVVRYVNAADIVARIPVMGFKHTGDVVYINRKGELVHNPSPMYMRLDSFWRVWTWIKDHRMTEYVKRLEKAKN